MTGRKEAYRPAGDRESLADSWPTPDADTVRKMLAILRGGAR